MKAVGPSDFLFRFGPHFTTSPPLLDAIDLDAIALPLGKRVKMQGDRKGLPYIFA
ncbi:MAG: hypothetical protein NVS4B11_14470 [Ktedonobacteraceae bacterium]